MFLAIDLCLSKRGRAQYCPVDVSGWVSITQTFCSEDDDRLTDTL